VTATIRKVNHQLTKKFLITTTYRSHLSLEATIDHRLCYVSYPNCKIVLQDLAKSGTPKKINRVNHTYMGLVGGFPRLEHQHQMK